MQAIQALTYETFPPAPLSEIPTGSLSRPAPVQASDPWFVAARMVRPYTPLHGTRTLSVIIAELIERGVH